jgi:ABC-type amino acid transport substrate-binding protein
MNTKTAPDSLSPQVQALLARIEAKQDEVVALTQDLVRIPTVNPPGDAYEASRRRPPVHINIPSFRLREAFLAIPVREGHENYKQINEAMLQFTMSEAWIELLQQWIGDTTPRL